jgi:hypothetical protein
MQRYQIEFQILVHDGRYVCFEGRARAPGHFTAEHVERVSPSNTEAELSI